MLVRFGGQHIGDSVVRAEQPWILGDPAAGYIRNSVVVMVWLDWLVMVRGLGCNGAGLACDDERADVQW